MNDSIWHSNTGAMTGRDWFVGHQRRMERFLLVLASSLSLSMGQQGLLSITQHPRDTRVAPGGTVSSLWIAWHSHSCSPTPLLVTLVVTASDICCPIQASLSCGHTVPPSLAARGLRVSWFREGIRLTNLGGGGPNSNSRIYLPLCLPCPFSWKVSNFTYFFNSFDTAN